MIVKLLRDARIKHYAGEIVKVSPAEGAFLLSIGSAVETAVKKEPIETRKKKGAK